MHCGMNVCMYVYIYVYVAVYVYMYVCMYVWPPRPARSFFMIRRRSPFSSHCHSFLSSTFVTHRFLILLLFSCCPMLLVVESFSAFVLFVSVFFGQCVSRTVFRFFSIKHPYRNFERFPTFRAFRLIPGKAPPNRLVIEK